LPETVDPPVLRRKIGAPASPLDQAGMGPAKALRIAFARAAEDVAEMVVAVVGFTETRQSLEDIAKSLDDPHLIVTTKGPAGAVGLALWDMQSVSAFIEQLVTGRVVPSPAEERAPTPTDAAVLLGVLNAVLKGFDTELAQVVSAPPVKGFRHSGLLEDGRAVGMALEDVAYRNYRLSLDLGGGAKKGVLQLIFPWENSGARSPQFASSEQWAESWSDSLQDAQAPVLAILHRMSMPLSDIAQFEVGTVIPVPTETIGAVSLEGHDHRPIAAGRLGQSNGHRAVRIISAVVMDQDAGAAVDFQNAAPSQGVQSLPAAGGIVPPPEVSPPMPAVVEPVDAQTTVADADGLAVS